MIVKTRCVTDVRLLDSSDCVVDALAIHIYNRPTFLAYMKNLQAMVYLSEHVMYVLVIVMHALSIPAYSCSTFWPTFPGRRPETTPLRFLENAERVLIVLFKVGPPHGRACLCDLHSRRGLKNAQHHSIAGDGVRGFESH